MESRRAPKHLCDMIDDGWKNLHNLDNEITDKSFLPNRDMEWYFFSPRDKKYPNGLRTNRATEAGYWKATGKDRKVSSQLGVNGMKKTLVFYRGRAPQGGRTGWVMHEYRLDEECKQASGLQDAFVLCRVFKKSEQAPKNDGQYGSLIGKSDLSLAVNHFCPNKLAALGDVENSSEESYSQARKQGDKIQANSRLTQENSLETLNDMTEDNAALNRWLELLLDDADPNSIFKSFGKIANNSKVHSMPGDTRLPYEPSPPPLQGEDFSQFLVDTRCNEFGLLNGSLLHEQMDVSFEEEDSLEEALHVARAPQDEGKQDNQGTSMVENLDALPGQQRPGIQICPQSSAWQTHQHGLPGHTVRAALQSKLSSFADGMLNVHRHLHTGLAASRWGDA